MINSESTVSGAFRGERQGVSTALTKASAVQVLGRSLKVLKVKGTPLH